MSEVAPPIFTNMPITTVKHYVMKLHPKTNIATYIVHGQREAMCNLGKTQKSTEASEYVHPKPHGAAQTCNFTSTREGMKLACSQADATGSRQPHSESRFQLPTHRIRNARPMPPTARPNKPPDRRNFDPLGAKRRPDCLSIPSELRPSATIRRLFDNPKTSKTSGNAVWHCQSSPGAQSPM
jgi:hypothetical protein